MITVTTIIIMRSRNQCTDFILVQTVPAKPVENAVASRVDRGRVNISWTPLSLVEARGFPLYTVSYMSDGDQVKNVITNESSVIIRGLNPHGTYIFTIQVSTESGTGETTQSQFDLSCMVHAWSVLCESSCFR